MLSYLFKFALLGDSGVGKSQLLRSFTGKPFNREHVPTDSSVEFCTRNIIFEKSVLRAQLWDTCLQDRREKFISKYLADAVGTIIVYDVTSRASYDHAKSIWMERVINHDTGQLSRTPSTCSVTTGPIVPPSPSGTVQEPFVSPTLSNVNAKTPRIILLGNKVDLVRDGHATRAVDIEEARAFAKEHNIDFHETSALTGEGVEYIFRRLICGLAEELPDLRVHLEVTTLPRGWIRISKAEVALNSVTATIPSEFTAQSVPGSPRNVDRTSYNNLAHSESVQIPLSTASTAPSDVPTDDQDPTLSEIYLNYWTGETQTTIPNTPAPYRIQFVATYPSAADQSNQQSVIDSATANKSSPLRSVAESVDDQSNAPVPSISSGTSSGTRVAPLDQDTYVEVKRAGCIACMLM